VQRFRNALAAAKRAAAAAKRAAAAALAAGRAAWAKVPEPVQRAAGHIAIAGTAAVVALNLPVPSDIAGGVEAVRAAVFAAWTAVLVVVRVELIPALVAWLLSEAPQA
jgi:hypothetical protein